MPETLTAPPLENPVFDETAEIKALAAQMLKPQPAAIAPAPAAPPAPAPAAAPAQAPTPAPAAAPEEPEDEKLEPGESPSHENFKRVVQSKKELKRQAEEGRKALEQHMERVKALEAEVQKYKGLGINPDEVQKLREEREQLAKERDQMLERVETINLERSPRFQGWWKTETEKHVKVAQRVVPADKREELGKLLMEPVSEAREAAINEIVDGLPNTSKRIVDRAIEALEAVKMQREEALDKGSARYKELQKVEQQEQLQAAEARKQKLAGLTQKALAKAETLSAFTPDPNDAEHTAQIPQRKALIEAFFNGQVDEDVAVNTVLMAVEGAHVKNRVLPKVQAELAKANELIKQLQGSAPRPSEGTAPAAAKPGEGEEDDFEVQMRRFMPGRK